MAQPFVSRAVAVLSRPSRVRASLGRGNIASAPPHGARRLRPASSMAFIDGSALTVALPNLRQTSQRILPLFSGS